MPSTCRGCLSALAIATAVLLCAPAAATPRVVVTIAPVHSLVAAVMDGVGVPALLLAAGVSPHAHALRPSQRQELERADLVLWVGPALERFLPRALAGGGGHRRALALMDVADIQVLPARAGGVFAAHGEPHRSTDGAGHDHGTAHRDPHVWLSPENARAIVALAARELSELDPANASRYAANAARFRARIDQESQYIRERLAPVRGVPYVVFHDAYQAFENYFELTPVAAVSVSPERVPGARRVAEIRARIVASGARCVFSEPQFEPRLVATLIEGSGARAGVLDPLGSAITPGPQAWFTLMRQLADALAGCLSG